MKFDPQFFQSRDFAVEGPPREIVGYGEHPPNVEWEGGAKVAVQIVINYEEGSEKTFAMGDGVNDILYELPFAIEGQRDLAVETMYEYCSRAGIWRLLRVFDNAGIPVTWFAAAVALERNPAAAEKLARRGDEAAGHGYRWSNHFEMTREEEREAIKRAIESIERTRVGLKGPVTTPVGGGFSSINVALRQKFELYANFRPIRNLPHIPTRYPDVDLIIVRENTRPGLAARYSAYSWVLLLQASTSSRHRGIRPSCPAYVRETSGIHRKSERTRRRRAASPQSASVLLRSRYP